MAAPEIKYYTVEEFYADKSLPERCELIGGEVCMSPPPSRIHQKLVHKISCSIDNYIVRNKGGCEVYQGPAGVQLTDDSGFLVEPDIFVTCKPENYDEQKYNGAPDWVIEVVSPSDAKKDYIVKKSLYEKAGVREYWIVDPQHSIVQVYIWEGGTDVQNYSFDDDIPVYIYKDRDEKLSINISSYFAEQE